MNGYIDGFVFPVASKNVEAYRQVAQAVAEIYKEHGALEYQEFIGDDMNREGTKSFPDLVCAGEEEVIIFGWAVYESKDARDLVNTKVESDPRMASLVEPLLDPSAPIFEPIRMAYAGFRPLVRSQCSEGE